MPEVQRLEELSLNAWPALRQMLLDGWVLRFSKGYTKRANSVNVLYPAQQTLEDKVACCEQFYAERGLPPIFRLTPLAPPGLEALLAQRGYRRIDETLVLVRDLSAALPDACPPPRAVGIGRWLESYCHLVGVPLAEHSVHREILEAIAPRRFLAEREQGGAAVACGVAVLEGEYVGLFDLVTDPAQRRQGHATALVGGLLAWARANGARYAYLQVVADNAPAQALYARLGFQTAYTYAYRVR